jgi:hypothetical protein
LILLEAALDFAFGSGVDIEFILRHGIFGKSKPQTDRGGPGQLRYGGRHSDKLVRAYHKSAIEAFRVELELHSRLLRSHRIHRLEDVDRALTSIVLSHFQLAHIHWSALRSHLLARFQTAGLEILATAKARSASIHEVLRYLRNRPVNNVHRFLRPMTENQLALAAAANLAITFAGGVL